MQIIIMKKFHFMIKGKNDKRLFKALRFLILLNLFSLPLYIILFLGLSFVPLQNMTAIGVSKTLDFLGIDNELKGLSISLEGMSTGFMGKIDWDCTGWKSMLAFAALVLATNESRRKKILGLALLPAVYIANILRITFVFAYVAYFGAEYFELIHSFMFSFAMIAFILALWVVWLKYFNVRDFEKTKNFDKKGNKKRRKRK